MLDFFNGQNKGGIDAGMLGLSLLGASQGGQGQDDIGSILLKLAMSGALKQEKPEQNNGESMNMPTPGFQGTPQVTNPMQQDISATPSMPRMPNFSSDPVNTLRGMGYGQDVLDKIPGIASKIGAFESGNRYDALGPPTKTGDRAFGKYQVMGANIPMWTKEVVGKSMTPQEFLNDPAAQDAVAVAKMAQSYTKYGTPEDVASIWFSGRPFKNNNRRDVIGTSVPQYIRNTVGR